VTGPGRRTQFGRKKGCQKPQKLDDVKTVSDGLGVSAKTEGVNHGSLLNEKPAVIGALFVLGRGCREGSRQAVDGPNGHGKATQPPHLSPERSNLSSKKHNVRKKKEKTCARLKMGTQRLGGKNGYEGTQGDIGNTGEPPSKKGDEIAGDANRTPEAMKSSPLLKE